MGSGARCVGCFVAALFCSALRASDVAVLVDVSGTMGHYGSWQGDASKLAQAVLSGSQPDLSAWACNGQMGDIAEFRLQPGQRVHLLRFGSIRSSEFPFFAAPQSMTTLTPFAEQFPNDSSLFTQAKTNKTLAQAVGSQLAEAGGVEGRLIVISDFLVDSDLNPAQLQFVNALESRTKTEPPLICSWKSNPNVQVKLIRVSVREPSVSGAAAPVTVRLQAARVLDGSPKRVQFQWRIEGAAQARYFDVTVRDSSNRKVDWVSRNLVGTSAVWTGAKSGKKNWQVRAVLEDGREVMSAGAPIEVPGSNIPVVLAALAAAVGLGGSAYYLAGRRKRSQKPAPAA